MHSSTPPTNDPKYEEFGDHGKRLHDTLTKDRKLDERQLEAVRELARMADARSVINNLSSTYQKKIYSETKTFPEIVTMANLYAVERRENEAPAHRTITGICTLLGVNDAASIREAIKRIQEKEKESAACLENIVKL